MLIIANDGRKRKANEYNSFKNSHVQWKMQHQKELKVHNLPGFFSLASFRAANLHEMKENARQKNEEKAFENKR